MNSSPPDADSLRAPAVSCRQILALGFSHLPFANSRFHPLPDNLLKNATCAKQNALVGLFKKTFFRNGFFQGAQKMCFGAKITHVNFFRFLLTFRGRAHPLPHSKRILTVFVQSFSAKF